MKILLLSPYAEKLTSVLSQNERDSWIVTEEPVTPYYLREHGIELGISYGYRHILKKDILDICSFINLHISYLPWNRGAHPNIWSWVDDTPKGVTIHYIDEGIDTGDIIAQKEVEMAENETLRTSYDKLQAGIEGLFAEIWPSIRTGQMPRIKQQGNGSLHYAADIEKLERFLTQGYDTPVRDLVQSIRMSGT